MRAGVAVDRALMTLNSDQYIQEELELAALSYNQVFEIEDKLKILDSSAGGIDLDKWTKLFLA